MTRATDDGCAVTGILWCLAIEAAVIAAMLWIWRFR